MSENDEKHTKDTQAMERHEIKMYTIRRNLEALTQVFNKVSR